MDSLLSQLNDDEQVKNKKERIIPQYENVFSYKEKKSLIYR